MQAHDPQTTANRAVASAGESLSAGGKSPSASILAAAIGGLLLLAVAMVFGQTVGFDFVNYDDPLYVCDNPHIFCGLSGQGIAWAFTGVDFYFWHPLTWLSLLSDFQFYGLHPWGYHLTNVLLHAATTILLFVVLRRMTGDVWPSAFVAAVFAIHPLQAESVAWIAERKGVLSGLFFVLTLAAYLGYVRHPFSLARYLAVAVLLVLGLMAKPMLVTVAPLLLLLDYWPLGRLESPLWSRTNARLLVEKIPLLMVTAAFCVVTFLAEGDVVGTFENFPLSVRITNALVSCAAYLGHLFYPVGLAPFYPHPGAGLPTWKAVAALLALVTISVVVAARWRRNPYLVVGWLWYLGMLVPVSGLVQVGAHGMADRYAYLPHIGLTIGLAWAAKDALASSPLRARLCGAASMLAILIFMLCAWRQTSYWRDSQTLWEHDLECVAPNVLAYNNLGGALASRGQADEALAMFRRALEVKPDSELAYHNVGLALAQRGQLDEAIVNYQNALKIKPDFALAHNDLGHALLRQGKVDEAVAHLEKALEIRPGYATAHHILGLALAARGQMDDAAAQYRVALELNPDYVEVHNNLGLALAARGQVEEAIAHYQKALELKPDYVEAHNNLGNVLAERGQFDEAMAHFQKALEIQPDCADASYNLSLARSQRQAVMDSLARRRQQLRLHPDDLALVNDTAWILATDPNASVRNGAEAVELAQRAVQLCGGREPAIVSTLAAAYAEAGRFAEAVQAARQALKLASSQGNAALAHALRARIKLYETGSPYRDLQPPALPQAEHP